MRQSLSALRWLRLLLLPLLLLGCRDARELFVDDRPSGAGAGDGGAEPSPTPSPDPTMPDGGMADGGGPLVPDPDPALQGTPELLYERPVRFVVPMPEGGWLADTREGLIRSVREGADPIDLGAETGEVVGAALFASRALVVAGSEGLFVVEDGALEASPIDDLLGDVALAGLLSAPGPTGSDLWIATDVGLRLFRDEQLLVVRPGDLPATDAQLRIGPPRDGLASIWVTAEGEVYALAVGSEEIRAWPSELDMVVDAFAVDGLGQLWVAAEGALSRLSPSGERQAFELPFAVTQLVAEPGSEDLWIGGAERELWHQRGGSFRPVAEIPPAASLVAGPEGQLLAYGPEGLYRLRPGRHVVVQGLRSGELLTAPVTLEIAPGAPEEVGEVRVRIDDAEQILDGPPWSLVLDPADFAEGAHLIEIEVMYNDGAPPASARLRFAIRPEVGPPTWSADVQLLSEAHCARCHGDGAFAHPMHTLEHWRSEIEDIVDAIVEDRMPLPPNPRVTADGLARIEAWRDAGFLE